jgi:CRP/FNR family transcriptional activator FtrB
VLDANALMGARTVDRSEIMMIPGDAIRRAMADTPAFGLAVARELSGCYRGLVRSLKNQKLRSGAERLANYILTLRAKADGADVIQLPHEKRVLASLLGMTPENLSRAFGVLQNYGVAVEGPTLHIGSLRDLQRLAKPDPLIDNHAPRAPSIRHEADAEQWSSLRAQA